MIAITAASGHLGHLVIDQLLQKVPAKDVVAVIRNPDKAHDLKAKGVHVRLASYDDEAAVERAFQGVTQLLFISGSEVGRRVAQHTAVVNAAKAARVGSIAYTSILGADSAQVSLAIEHRATEKAIRESSVPYVFLRNGWYVENYTENLGPALEHGALFGAAKNGRISAAPRADYAAAAVSVLTSDGHLGKVYELGGDESFTMSDLASEVSKQSGKTVVYTDMPADEYAGLLQSFGVPEAFARALADADEGVARGELETHSGDLRRLIGRPTTSLADSVAAALRR